MMNGQENPLDEKYIFLHVPKTAGTSFTQLMGRLFSPEHVSQTFALPYISEETARNLRQFKVVSGHVSYLEVQKWFPGRKMIAFLRDPIDRCISWYHFAKTRYIKKRIPINKVKFTNSPEEVLTLAQLLDIDDFFLCNHPHMMQSIENAMVWQLGYHMNYEKRDLDPAFVFRLAKNNLKHMWFIGLYETLNHDVTRFLKALGAQGKCTLPHVNATRGRPRRSDLSPRTIRILKKLNEMDYQLYDYAQELVSSAEFWESRLNVGPLPDENRILQCCLEELQRNPANENLYLVISGMCEKLGLHEDALFFRHRALDIGR
jgi:hypothetical protein